MKKATPIIAWNSLPGPEDITRVELPNGITILTRSNFESPSVVINGYLPSGSLFDPPEKLGLSYFTALALMRGAGKRNFQEIFNSLETVGASLGFSASVHNTTFGGRSLAEDLPLMLGVLADCLRTPTFPPDQIERLRAQLLTGLALRAQDTADMASITFDAAVFAGHPYGNPEDGYVETVQPITRADLVDFHKRRYGPRGAVIVVVGAVTADHVIEQIRKVLGDWQNPEQTDPPALPAIAPLTQTIRKHVPLAGKSQNDLVIGTLGPKRCATDYLAASLGNSVLGQFGMMGRIGEVVREQAGLAYYASTSLNAWIESGSWEVSAGVNPANTQRAIDLIRSEIERFVREPVSAEELENSQANYIGRLPLSLESNAGVAGAILNLERFQLGLDYYLRYPERVQRVTVEAVLEAAQHYLDPDKLAIISAGV
ncbi:MAG TPA: pitrilysin family protein [Anaerolineaceae bacterium]|mgnify:FL=1|nr:insulinase family protein [Longilinea sp.]HNR46576.1 pitrilysin family protein [Anaerolineaceae bacterium]HNS37458.1 pitrilysin family protein [Anaerolineaceae bacterium]HNZ12683.1 pitrilysin family protein [Anaerolineaceae bacterium]HOG78646.1 pitrilysin family protein [Anaerolineaceae bacterium]